MVIGDFHIGRLSVIPTEYQTPLLVDSHAPEALEIAGKGFETVAWRNPQIGRVKLAESQESPFLNISRKFLRPTSIPDHFGFLA
jgi:hypothetical protein